MFEGMERGELRTLYVMGENPAQSEADSKKALEALEGLDFLIAQDILMTKTCEHGRRRAAGVGVVVRGGRRDRDQQRAARSADAQGARPARAGARRSLDHLSELARRLGHDWGQPTLEEIWDECRSLSPMHRGMSYRRLEELGGIQWPCPSEDHAGSPFLHGRLWDEPVGEPRAPFSVTKWVAPIDELNDEFPIRLTTGRRLDSYNTGVQSNLYSSPLRRGETLDLSPGGRRRSSASNPARSYGSALAAGRSTLRCGSTRDFGPGWRS